MKRVDSKFVAANFIARRMSSGVNDFKSNLDLILRSSEKQWPILGEQEKYIDN